MALADRYPWAPAPAYKITKAALNALSVQYAQELGKEGFIFVIVSPGVGQSRVVPGFNS
jgi:NAD(P)-dependent dehydrogenase (short-subunit alcohol dehydrogenase family)